MQLTHESRGNHETVTDEPGEHLLSLLPFLLQFHATPLLMMVLNRLTSRTEPNLLDLNSDAAEPVPTPTPPYEIRISSSSSSNS